MEIPNGNFPKFFVNGKRPLTEKPTMLNCHRNSTKVSLKNQMFKGLFLAGNWNAFWVKQNISGVK